MAVFNTPVNKSRLWSLIPSGAFAGAMTTPSPVQQIYCLRSATKPVIREWPQPIKDTLALLLTPLLILPRALSAW